MRIRSLLCWRLVLPALTGTILIAPAMAIADSATPFLSRPLGVKTASHTQADAPDTYVQELRTEKSKNKTDRLINENDHKILIQSDIHISDFSNAPQQISRTSKEILQKNPQAQALQFRLIAHGLHGPALRLMTADLRRAGNHESSPQEIWRNAEFSLERPDGETEEGLHTEPYLWLVQDNQLGWDSEEKSDLLYRSSLIAEARAPEILEIITLGTAFRLNIADNLGQLDERGAPLPVRSDVEKFTDRALGLERLYATAFHSLSPELHTAFTAGYLEEMVAGFGGEILYRPFESRFAVGAELWQTVRRDPDTSLNLGLNGDPVLTGHLNAWYDWPGHDVTLFMQAGRYLAEDIGVTAGLEKDFAGGAVLKGFVTVTDDADADSFGGESHTFQGISLSLPLGGLPVVPDGSAFRLRAEPFGRNSGQSVDKPVSLYSVTEPFTLDHMAKYWDGVVE